MVTITQIQYTNGTGTYVGGMSFTVRVTFSNTGGTDATADAVLTFNGGTYTFLSQSNPAPVSVAAGGTQAQDFLVAAAIGATTATVTINATFSATEAISGRVINGNAGSNVRVVNVQARSFVVITQIQYTNGTGTYVGGMAFTVRVTFSNTGGTSATVDATLTFGGYGSLVQSDPAPVTVAASGTQVQDFLVTVSTSAATSAVTINATWTGTEAISGRSLSGNAGSNVRSVNIQARANVAITSVVAQTGNGTYVAGMSFMVRVTLSNTGGTSATVDATLSFSGYGYMTQSNPAAVVIGPSGTQFQDFTVSIDQAATSMNPVVILTTWTGTEAISGRAISGDQGSHQLNVKVQSAAVLAITNVFNMNGTRPYSWGENFTVRVSIANTGGTAIENISVQLTFGSAIGLTTVPSIITGLVIGSGGSINAYLVVKIAAGATLGTVVITAQVLGDEAISGRDLVDTSSMLQVNIESSSVTINAITTSTPPPYTNGSILVVTVQLIVGSGITLANGTLTLYFTSTYLSAVPAFYTNMTGSGTITRTFSVTIDAGATPGSVTINANFTGRSTLGANLTDEDATSPLTITILAPSSVSITAIVDVLGTHAYVQGMQFDVRVTFTNIGGLGVKITAITLEFNRSNYYNLPVESFIVNGGSTVSRDVTVVVQLDAEPGNVHITALATGEELGTEKPLNLNSAPVGVTVQVTTRASISITSIQYTTGSGTYIEHHSFIIRVAYSNTGGTAATNVVTALSFGGYPYLSSNASASITVPAFGVAYLYFNITVASGATNAAVTINATWTGLEDISERAMSGNAGANVINVQIQRAAALEVESVQDLTGSPRYVQGMSFTVRVRIANMGGTDVLNANIWLVFNRTGYSATSSIVNVTAGNSVQVDLVVTVGLSAQVGPISINGRSVGFEAFTGDTVSDLDGVPTPLVKVVQASSQLVSPSCVDITGQMSYIQGQSLLVNVTLDNSAGGTAVVLGTLSLAFNASGYSTPQHTGITINAGQILILQFNVSISIDAQDGFVRIDATFSGKEQYSMVDIVRSAISPLVITCKSRANVRIANIIDPISTKVHKLGTSFTFNVTLANLGDAIAISGVLSISLGTAINITVAPLSYTSIITSGSSNTIYQFLVTIAKPASTGNFTVTFTYSGLEGITNRPLSHVNATWIFIQDESDVRIELIESLSGPGPFTQGQSLYVRVRLINLGPVGVFNGVLTLVFPVGSSGYTSNPPSETGITLGGSDIITKTFQVNIGSYATTGSIQVDAEFHAIESGTLESKDILGATTKLSFQVKARPASLQLVPGSVSINWSAVGPNIVYQGQRDLIVTFIVSNPGGASAAVDFSGVTFTNPYGGEYSFRSYPGSNPALVNPGSTASFGFAITVSQTATLNTVITISMNILATDSFWGNQTTWTAALSWWRVHAQKVLPDSASFQHNDFVQGEQNINLTIRLTNTGIYPANITGVTLRFMNGTTNYASWFTITANRTFPFVMNANTNTWIRFEIDVAANMTPNIWMLLLMDIVADHTRPGAAFNLSSGMVNMNRTCVVRTPAQLRVTSVVVMNGRVNATRGQANIGVQVTILNLNGTRATLSAIVLVFNNTLLNGDFFVQYVDAVVGSIVNGFGTATYTLRMGVSQSAAIGRVIIDARVYATGSYIGNNASHVSGALVTTSLLVLEPGALPASISVAIFEGSLAATGGKLTVTIRFSNTGGTAIVMQLLTAKATIRGNDVDSAMQLQPPSIAISAQRPVSARVVPGAMVEITIEILVSDKIGSIARQSDLFMLVISIQVIDENTGAQIIGSGSASVTITKELTAQIMDFFTDYMLFIIAAIGGLIVVFAAVGARKAQIKKAAKAKIQQGKGKEYFAKQMAMSTGKPAPTEGKLAPFIGKEAPIGKGKKAAEAAAQEEKMPELTPEQLAELQQTEAEVTTFKEKKICLVHKGPVAGNIYLCPQCDALYCVKCAGALKQAGEKCWQCGAPIQVSDFAIAEAQAAAAAVPPAAPGAVPGAVPISLAPGAPAAIPAAAPAKPAGPSYVMRNMNRINAAMQAMNMPHEMKMKYLKEMNAMAEPDQVRFLMEIEKMAYPDKVVADEVAPASPAVEDKLPQMQYAMGDPVTQVTDADVRAFLGQDFTTLEQALVDQVNVLPWPKEKKLACLKELLALTPQERADLLQEMFRQDTDDE
ncbi:MAG: hypothetical protein Q6373_008835 [Candidatus Sigynarchaeota archaeon]